MSLKDSLEKPTQVFLHEEENQIYNASSTMLSQFERQIAMAAPLMPSPSFRTKAQQRRICTKPVTPVARTIGKTMFWACRNLIMHRRSPLAVRLGIK
ncbi:hypothetical protein SESBI_36146 [Sesbania bispinosa]|nr:hypothetical protein SESBI_36146 [Sesbania bispinosa]